MEKMNPYAEVLYKTDETPGWYGAIISGDETCVDQKCKKLWKNYKVFSGNEKRGVIEDEYPVNLDPWWTHLLHSWIYSNELNKWFMYGEIIPRPVTECDETDNLEICFEIPCDRNKISHLIDLHDENIEFYEKDVVDILAYFRIKTDTQKLPAVVDYSNYVELQFSSDVSYDFRNFLQKLKKENFSVMYIGNFYYLKILSWR